MLRQISSACGSGSIACGLTFGRGLSQDEAAAGSSSSSSPTLGELVAAGGGSQAALQLRLQAAGLSAAQCERLLSEASSGEVELASIARALRPADFDEPFSCVAVDEYGSCLDAAARHELGVRLRRYIRSKRNVRLLVASVHVAAVRALLPDWHYDAQTARLDVFSDDATSAAGPDPPPAQEAPASMEQCFGRVVIGGEIQHCQQPWSFDTPGSVVRGSAGISILDLW